MVSATRETLDALYEELQQCILQIWGKDREVTKTLKDIHLDFVSQFALPTDNLDSRTYLIYVTIPLIEIGASHV